MSAKIKLFLLTGLLLAVALLVWQPVFAQEPQPTPSDDDINRVAKQMYCPVCENIPLDVCPTQACQEWRGLIELKLREGWTDEQIKDYFVEQYGDRVLAEPPRRGLNWLLYIVPPVIILGASVFVWRMMVSMKRKAIAAASNAVVETSAAAGAALPDEYEAYIKKLEDELKKSE